MPKWVAPLALIILFLTSFLMRAVYPVSRPPQWYGRSAAFREAVQNQSWDRTYQSNHPGFTVMVIGATSLALHDAAPALFDWATPPFATAFGSEVGAGVAGLSFVIALLLVALAVLLERLAGWVVALTAAFLISLSPAYLAQQRVFHVDGLLSILIILSCVLIVLYGREKDWRWLLLSGVVGGFAILTKAPGVFTIPFAGLVLGVTWLLDGPKDLKALARVLPQQVLLPLGVWLLMMALPFLLWPAIWVDGFDVITRMFDQSLEIGTVGHPMPRFFLDRIWTREEDISALYYPVTLAYTLTYLSFILLLTSMFMVAVFRDRLDLGLRTRDYLFFAAAAVFFAIMMTLGSKKSPRYIAPAYPALIIMSAVGLKGLIELTKATFDVSRYPVTALGVVGVIALQALTVVTYFPDVGVYRNHLFGGIEGGLNVIEVGTQNEGVIAAARYLNTYDPQARVGLITEFSQSMRQFHEAYELTISPEWDYNLFTRLVQQRGILDAEGVDLLMVYESRNVQPVLTVSYDGVEYLWLYADDPDGITPVTRQFGWQGFYGVGWLLAFGVAGIIVVGTYRHYVDKNETIIRRGMQNVAAVVTIIVIAVVGGVIYNAYRQTTPNNRLYASVDDLPDSVVAAQAEYEIGLELVGYEVHGTGGGPLVFSRSGDVQQVAAGDELAVTLYWRATQPLYRPHSTSLFLLGRDWDVYAEEHGAIGQHGLRQHTTDEWQPGQIYADRHLIPVTYSADEPAVVDLVVTIIAYLEEDPQTLVNTDEPRLFLSTLRADATQPPTLAASQPTHTFGQFAHLLDGDVALDGQQVDVTLRWQATAAAPTDYQAFIHIIDPQGEIVAQGDSPPLAGELPTSLWREGDLFTDEYTVQLPEGLPADDYQVVFGFYDLDTLQRPPVTLPDGTPQPGNAVTLDRLSIP